MKLNKPGRQKLSSPRWYRSPDSIRSMQSYILTYSRLKKEKEPLVAPGPHQGATLMSVLRRQLDGKIIQTNQPRTPTRGGDP